MNAKQLSLAVSLLVAPAFVAGCSKNPATGNQSFTAFMSEEKERIVGAEEHPKIVKEFGGEYNDPKL